MEDSMKYIHLAAIGILLVTACVMNAAHANPRGEEYAAKMAVLSEARERLEKVVAAAQKVIDAAPAPRTPEQWDVILEAHEHLQRAHALLVRMTLVEGLISGAVLAGAAAGELSPPPR